MPTPQQTSFKDEETEAQREVNDLLKVPQPAVARSRLLIPPAFRVCGPFYVLHCLSGKTSLLSPSADRLFIALALGRLSLGQVIHFT